MNGYRYAWPASQLNEEDMFLLYQTRERIKQTGRRTTISMLVKEAVRGAFEGNEGREGREAIATNEKIG